MKALLLSSVYEDGHVVLKFYEPKTHSLILWRDNTGHKPHCYVSPLTANKIGELPGITIESKSVYNVIKNEYQEVAKVTADSPRTINELQESTKTWEADIRHHQNYLYDNNLIVGKWYMVGEVISPIVYNSKIDVSAINTESVIEVNRFMEQCKKWASLLDEPIPEMNRLAFDIEVEMGTEMPDPLVAGNRVTAIGLQSNTGLKKVFVLDRPEIPKGDPHDGTEIIFFKSEKQMLEEAFKVIESYPIVLTFNGDMFDMPYLYNRAIRLGLTSTPFRMMKRNATLNMGVHIDLYGVFSNHSLKVYAFKNKYVENGLDSVSSAILGEHKIEIEFENSTLHDLGYYCMNDTDLTMKLTTYDNNIVMRLLVILSRISNMPIDDVSRLSISHWSKSLLYFYHRQRNELIPAASDFPQVGASTLSIGDKKYQGAVVFEPQPGIHFTVTAMDFASLYPSIIKTRNISYETVRCSHDECKTNKIPYTEHWACTKKTGAVSMLIGSLKELRVGHYKKLSKSASEDEKKQYEVISESIKVFLNASYGVIGFENFPLYYLPTAESVTSVGREIITNTVNQAKDIGMNVLMGDTDSFYVKEPTREQINHMIAWTKSTYSIDLEVDKEYRYIVLSDRKKNYFGVKKDGKLDIKGLTGKKSNTPGFIKKIFSGTLEQLKAVNSIGDFDAIRKGITEQVRDCVVNFDKIPLDDIAFKVMINKDPAEYKTKTQPIKAAEQLGITVKKGQFISFVKTRTEPKVKPIQMVSRNEIDKEKYIEALQTTLEQIIEPMGLDFETIVTGTKQSTLF